MPTVDIEILLALGLGVWMLYLHDAFRPLPPLTNISDSKANVF